jgi:hypothetical protein
LKLLALLLQLLLKLLALLLKLLLLLALEGSELSSERFH